MTKCFRSDDLNQSLLMPPSLHDWLPENHLGAICGRPGGDAGSVGVLPFYEAKDGRGQAAYSPVLMVRLLVYGYCTGVVSSRQIEKRTHEDVAFRYLSADTHPDHSTFNEFRKRHLEALAGLFLQALGLCRKAGLVKLGHVAVDGTKLQANASKHKAMSYGRMRGAEETLKAEVEELLKRAEAVDAVEDEKQRQGLTDQLPKELARRESRLKKIRQARAELEAEARQKAAQAKADAEARMAQRRKQEERTGKKTGGGQPRVPDPKQAAPDAKAQRNSPIRTAGSCPTARTKAVSCRPTMPRSLWTMTRKSSSRPRSPRTPMTKSNWRPWSRKCGGTRGPGPSRSARMPGIGAPGR